MIKKIFSIMILFCLLMVSGYSIYLETDQTDNIRDYSLSAKGNTFIYSVAGNLNKNITFEQSNVTYYYDFTTEIAETTQDFYIRIVNYNINTTGTFIFSGDLAVDGTAYVQPFTMEEVGTYYFRFMPTFDNEPSRIYLDLQDNFNSPVYYNELKPKSFNTLIGGLVTGFVDVINLNIMAWKISFALLIFGGTLIFVVSIFGLAFLGFRYAKKLRNGDSGAM